MRGRVDGSTGEVGVRVGAAVAEKRPVPSGFFQELVLAGGQEDFLTIVTGLRQDLTERVAYE